MAMGIAGNPNAATQVKQRLKKGQGVAMTTCTETRKGKAQEPACISTPPAAPLDVPMNVDEEDPLSEESRNSRVHVDAAGAPVLRSPESDPLLSQSDPGESRLHLQVRLV